MSDENNATIAGTLSAITETENVGAKQTPKRLAIVVTGGKYPETIAVEFFGDSAIKDLDDAGLREGDAVTIKCWVKGREFKGRYYTSLSARRGGVTRIGGDRSAAPTPTPAFGRDDGDLTDDLPF